MILNKIRIAIAEDKEEDLKIIKNAFATLSQYQIVLTALTGQELINKLALSKHLPDLILMDMQMPSGDGLITSIACYSLFPNIKIAGLSRHTFAPLINEFMAEGGCGFLSKFIVQKETAFSIQSYNDPNIFEKALDELIIKNKIYFDPLCCYQNDDYTKINSTKKIIQSKYAYLTKEQIIYLQLNAMGFKQNEICKIMNMSLVTLKRLNAKLFKIFSAKNHTDLVNISSSLGIIKLARFYQTFD
jgi:DNA-binding NarL/FixJ family response regulator